MQEIAALFSGSSGKFFLMAIGFLVLYTAYVNLGYIRFMQMPPYNVYLYDPTGTQTEKSPLLTVLLQTAILSLIMALVGLLCALLLKDFRQFMLAYLVIAIFAATPVFLSANTSVKFDWIGYHPFYHAYMGLKNAYYR